MPAAITSIQSRLIAAFFGLTLVALVVAGTIFVWLQRNDEEQAALNRRAQVLPALYAQTVSLELGGASEDQLAEFIRTAAKEQDLRLILVNGQGEVVEDSDGGGLKGVNVSGDEDYRTPPGRWSGHRYSKHSFGDGPDEDLILIGPPPGFAGFDKPIPGSDDGRPTADGTDTQVGAIETPALASYTPYVAVEQSTIARAWLGLLPGMAAAGAIALPAAILLAVLIARYITRPIHQLTLASQRLAEGDFNVDVSVGRRDEVGTLATTFVSMAARLGEAHSQMRNLIADVSHDLKTPLTSILGFSRALRDEAAPEKDRARIGGIIYEEAERLSDRLNDLLYLSELQSGRALVELADIDLDRLVAGVLGRLTATAVERGVTVESAIPADTVVRADGAKLERAVENLLDNALRYTPRGGRVLVTSHAGKGSLTLEIANPAPTLDEEELPSLFERFYRGDGSRSSNGSGLGLPIAKDLITLQGGTLTATKRGDDVVMKIALPGTVD